ncbi:peroxisomal membrane protein 2 [Ricinus communis]|uniref:peroxisomal membrane protein 2 n=1 Tax=Ricinus communis TaxID=3988 RepID=UPI00201A28B8|nr:peroxisomal membrane protein 2 [Ricinus communis]
MEALGSGNGAFWGWNWELQNQKKKKASNNNNKNNTKRNASSSDGVSGGGGGYHFPLKQAATAASLALTGDTIAQLSHRFANNKKKHTHTVPPSHDDDTIILLEHDWLRALRMTSYGFLFYGPGSYAWYQYLDHCLPKQSAKNLILKVLLNQIILGPSVIAVVFAWNNLWQGKLTELPAKYKKDALPTLLYGFRFWIPVSALNFWVVPLQTRVAFMSMGSIFWNFCLSSSMSK